MMRHRFFSMAAGVALLLTAGSAIAHADQGGNGRGNEGNGNGNGGPEISATPELDSIALFGTGAAGMAGYALMRLRAGRRQDKDSD
jgi:hypothetical protein